MPGDERILVIKHGALGDWVLATGCFAAIRRHHPSARITLLTTPAFADWGTHCPWFDEVWTDDRPSLLAKPLAWIRLRRRLIDGGFARVYDLQTSGRTGFYFRMLPRRRRPEWSGEIAGCTSLAQIAALARRATCAVGNDTGPIRIAATASCPTVVLFGAASNPRRYAPCGDSVTILQREPLASLPVDDVVDAAGRISARG